VSIGAAAIILVCLVVLFGQVRSALDPDLKRAQQLERYRQQDINSRLDWLDVAIAGAWRVFPLAAAAGVAYVALGIAWRGWGSRQACTPTNKPQ